MLVHGSLFSGIGGFDLAAHWMGWNNLFHCEIDPFCLKILQSYFPHAQSFKDIYQLPAAQFRGAVDLITGGFPCQPFSFAGKRAGTQDSRFLWPQMLRIIEVIQPTWVVAENVPGIANIEGGLVFEQVCSGMENCGYAVQPVVLPAACVGAPHLRNRVWFIAYSEGNHHRRKSRALAGTQPALRDATERSSGTVDPAGHVTHTHDPRLQGRQNPIDTTGQRQESHQQLAGLLYPGNWDLWPNQSPFCGRHDGVPGPLDGISFPKWRRESMRAFGNAIVPQVALEIFKVIQLMEKKLPSNCK